MARNVEQAELADMLLAQISVDARHELQNRLGPIGREIAAVQQSLTPVMRGKPRKNRVPGFLRSQIRSKVDITNLQVISGFPNFRNNGPEFYGRFVQKGRGSGEKLVTRTVPTRWFGKGRKRRKARVAYMLKWTSLPRRNFIHVERTARQIMLNRLGDFWETVLSRRAG